MGRLDSASTLLPDAHLFLYAYVRKEAVLSSQIEGTQSSLSDLLLYENSEIPGVPLDDVREVSNYVAALTHGLERLRSGFPLCLRLMREIHEILLQSGRGNRQSPGEFRTSQNWVGGSRPGNAVFVPPPPNHLADCLADLERFLHQPPEKTSALQKAALAHVQFETIHPFLDGNGRVGRLLITLLLCNDGFLHEPLLYLSLYFKENREQYYELLQRVRADGDWESWLAFFFRGVAVTATSAVDTAKSLVALFEQDRQRIETVGRSAGSALRVHHALQSRPVLSIAQAAERAQLSIPAATSAMKTLEGLEITKELTGRRRSRLFGYAQYVETLSEGT